MPVSASWRLDLLIYKDKMLFLLTLSFSQASDSSSKYRKLRKPGQIEGSRELIHSKASLVFITNPQKQALPHPKTRITFSSPSQIAQLIAPRIHSPQGLSQWYWFFQVHALDILPKPSARFWGCPTVKESRRVLNSQCKTFSISLFLVFPSSHLTVSRILIFSFLFLLLSMIQGSDESLWSVLPWRAEGFGPSWCCQSSILTPCHGPESRSAQSDWPYHLG